VLLAAESWQKPNLCLDPLEQEPGMCYWLS